MTSTMVMMYNALFPTSSC